MKAGEVIIENGRAILILEARSDGIFSLIPLRDHIEKTIVVYFGGEYRTIEEIIGNQYKAYMSSSTVHDR